MKHMIKFRCDIDVPLPHPDEMSIATFLGYAEITEEKEDGKTYLATEIVQLWLGVDIPSEPCGLHFRRVSTNNLGKLSGQLEPAAMEAFENPKAEITLPSEIESWELLKIE